MIEPHLEILNPNQAKIFPELSFLTGAGFYLAGDTALALQLGHRTSQDFDFYNQSHFDEREIFNKIEEAFSGNVQKTIQEKDTLFCRVSETELSFFWYQYTLIKKTVIIQKYQLAMIKKH